MRYYVLSIIFCFNFFGLDSFGSHATEIVEEGFVTFATENYFSLLEVLVESVHQFSTRPIIVFGVNTDIPFSCDKYPRLIKKRIDFDLYHNSIYYLKPRIILDSNISFGIYVEADDILNFGVDNLFQVSREIDRYPLCPIHPLDPNNQKNIMQAMQVQEKSMPYVHGHILFSQNCKSFIQEWYDACLRYHYLKPSNWDETILNVLLWKYKVAKYVELFDPYYECINKWIKGITDNRIKYYMFHGCKDPIIAKNILDELIRFYAKKS